MDRRNLRLLWIIGMAVILVLLVVFWPNRQENNPKQQVQTVQRKNDGGAVSSFGLPDGLGPEEDEKTAARPASEDPDAKEASAFDALFGSEGQVMEYGMISESDTAGARYIFLGYRTFSRGIAAILRVSKDKVVCWEMDRTGENTEKARQFLDSAVPMCYIASIENKQIKKSAVYIREKAENNPYERFLEDAEKVIGSLYTPKPLAEMSAGDPLLMDLSGISWDMTREELAKKFGRGLLPDQDSMMVYRKNSVLYGTLDWTITMKEGRPAMILVNIPEDKADGVRSLYNSRYGKAMMSLYTYAMIGKPKEDPKGDTCVWFSGDTLICLDGTRVSYIPFH